MLQFKFTICIIILLFPVLLSAQCFGCAKNYGGWTDDVVTDLIKTTDGIVFVGPINDNWSAGAIYKYDFNCNLVWQKELNQFSSASFGNAASDEAGNIYQLIYYPGNITYTTSEGFTLKNGLNMSKMSPSGDILWTKHVGSTTDSFIDDVFYSNGKVYVIGRYWGPVININDEVLLSNNPDTDHPNLFVAVYTTDGNLVEAVQIDSHGKDFSGIEMDHQGNIFLGTYINGSSFLKKIDTSYNNAWEQTLTDSPEWNSPTFCTPIHLYYSKFNDKVYLTSSYFGNIHFMGQDFEQSIGYPYWFASLITEHGAENGALTNFYKLDNSSSVSSGQIFPSGHTHVTGDAENLYVMTSFQRSLTFENGIVSSEVVDAGYNEDLLLFKINLQDFAASYIFKSVSTLGVINGSQAELVIDTPGPLVVNGDDIFITASFESIPLTINGTVINNNSGNNMMDALLYKHSVNASPGAGTIISEDTCLGSETSFNVQGSFDAITWNFDDPSSLDNVSTSTSPTHEFSGPGTYTVSAEIQCGTASQTIQKQVVIHGPPTINTLIPLYACETTPGSGISSAFDTSQLNDLLSNGQSNVSFNFFRADGTELPSPLPNPYTNINNTVDVITVKAFFNDNPDCFAQTSVQFIATTRPVANTIQNISACRDTGGIVVFDTSAVETSIIGSQTGMTVTYYDASDNLLPSPLPNPLTGFSNNETLTARITNPSSGCFNETTFNLIINEKPILNSGVELFGCDDDNDGISSSLNTGNLGSIFLDNPQGVSLSYYDTSGNFMFNDFPLNFQNTIPYQQNIIVRATNDSTGCYSETIFTLKTSSSPAINPLPILYACDNGNGYGEFITSGIEQMLVNNPSSVTIKYYNSGGGQLPSPLPNPYVNNIVDSEEIVIRVEDKNNSSCFTETLLRMIVLPAPIINIPDSFSYCEKDRSITIDAGNGFLSYQWSGNDGVISTSQYATIDKSGEYSLMISQNINGVICSSVKDFDVIEYGAPEILDIIIDDTGNDNTIEIIMDGNSSYQYSLNGIHYQQNNIFSGLSGGNYTVFVKDIMNCGIDTEKISIISYPKFFTPDNDGINDYWQVKGIHLMKNSYTYIFDRYGKLLASIGSNSPGWDGRYNNVMMPASDYWFKSVLSDGREVFGHFSLLR